MIELGMLSNLEDERALNSSEVPAKLINAILATIGETLRQPTACHCGQCRRWSGHVWASVSVPHAATMEAMLDLHHAPHAHRLLSPGFGARLDPYHVRREAGPSPLPLQFRAGKWHHLSRHGQDIVLAHERRHVAGQVDQQVAVLAHKRGRNSAAGGGNGHGRPELPDHAWQRRRGGADYWFSAAAYAYNRLTRKTEYRR